jgi:hypothetical protein
VRKALRLTLEKNNLLNSEPARMPARMANSGFEVKVGKHFYGSLAIL